VPLLKGIQKYIALKFKNESNMNNSKRPELGLIRILNIMSEYIGGEQEQASMLI
jgi:hypothetical protein